MSVNILLSYAFHDTTNLAKVRKNLVCGLLLIDSGAFTAYTKGRKIALDEYAGYLERWRDCWDHAITLDVIGDHDATMRNTRKLHERGLPVMPVFTRGGKIADFEAMVRDSGYVCVGGLVGLPRDAQKKRIGLLQRRAEDLGGGIHALGIGSLGTLRETRPYSADASSISGAFRFGTILYFDGRTIKSLAVTDRAKLTAAREHLRAHGVDLGLLARTGRMPGLRDRDRLMQAMGLAYACADEYLKRTRPVPAPWNIAPAGSAEKVAGLDTRIQDGTHLYSSIIGPSALGGGNDTGRVAAAAELDTQLHPGPHLYNAVGSAHGEIDVVASNDQRLHAGTHLFSSLGENPVDWQATSEIDRRIHALPTDLPPVWQRWGRNHTCNRRDASPDAS